MDNATMKKISQLDVAYNVARHLTKPGAALFIERVMGSIIDLSNGEHDPPAKTGEEEELTAMDEEMTVGKPTAEVPADEPFPDPPAKKAKITEKLTGETEEQTTRDEKPATEEQAIEVLEYELDYGDVVYVGDCPKPFRFIRHGWGDYAGEVRVALFDEDIAKWETGRWLSKERCYKLEVSDWLDVTKDIWDALSAPSMISKGTRCRFLGWDSDGDVRVHVNGKTHIIFRHDLIWLSLIGDGLSVLFVLPLILSSVLFALFDAS